jgi:FkbM family methyltransferase
MRLLQPLQMVPWNRKIYEGEYDSAHLRSYLALGHKGLRVVDIGANSGGFAGWLASNLSASTVATYTAFEPQGRLSECLEVACAGLPASVRAAAVTGLERIPDLVLACRPGGNAGEWTTAVPPEGGFPEGWQVQPIEQVLATDVPPCDILKLDCEGAEALILPAYPHLPRVQYLAYEWHGLEAMAICARAALAAGMVPVKAVRELPGRGVMCWGR